MGVAYFIVLDHPDPGFYPFVNGQAIALESRRLAKVASAAGVKPPDKYLSVSADDIALFDDDLNLQQEIALPPERWFDADEGLRWVTVLSAHIQANPTSVKDSAAVMTAS